MQPFLTAFRIELCQLLCYCLILSEYCSFVAPPLNTTVRSWMNGINIFTIMRIVVAE